MGLVRTWADRARSRACRRSFLPARLWLPLSSIPRSLATSTTARLSSGRPSSSSPARFTCPRLIGRSRRSTACRRSSGSILPPQHRLTRPHPAVLAVRMHPELDSLPLPALARHLRTIGVGEHHAPRVFRGLHRTRCAIPQIEGLGRHAKTLEKYGRRTQAKVIAVHDNPDETQKLLLELGDGARVESVIVPMRHDRATLCVSSQVGCAMACTFCATGTLGLRRSLTAGEILAQVHLAAEQMHRDARRLTRVVFMGMGEPLAAYDAVRDAVSILLDPHGPCMAAKHITVSTVGLVPRIRQLALDTGGRIQLALSLHAGTDETRAAIVPISRRYTIADLREALLAWPLPGSRALMVEVVVLPGINDDRANLDGIAAFMQDLRAVVNLIPFNPFPGAPFRTPTPDETLSMRDGLLDRGVLTKVRWPRGRAVHGACGQLMLHSG
ncbi:MAG: 23S rRNA (adenine(2503)-C(2))-methyltransferase RlmN [Deltaproteobacteria bacterium]|nr:MAG: 23S rRNA (adenine(2503)-C(2))-methyltransferase RlmN [Deltaproteobacteria bacterium]